MLRLEGNLCGDFGFGMRNTEGEEKHFLAWDTGRAVWFYFSAFTPSAAAASGFNFLFTPKATACSKHPSLRYELGIGDGPRAQSRSRDIKV